MQERIYEVLTFLLKRILKGKQSIDQKLVTQDLIDKGFEIDEIREAFEILEGTKQLNINNESNIFSSFRVLSDYEKFNFSPDAQGALIILEQFGVFSIYQLEEVIDRAMSFDLPEVTKREVTFAAMEVIAESNGITAAKDIWKFFERDIEGGD